jgi:hypothetical protein
MIIGFSKHYGAGGSGPALDYLTGYLTGGEKRAVAPEVVRGDPKVVANVIDALPFKRRYSSGVLSFAVEDYVTPEAQEDIMNRFENTVFAGLPSDRRSIVWIKHRDKGRTELHFVTPRVDFGTGKSLNIAPPTPASRDLLDTLRTSINRRYGFRDPSDPACAKPVSIPAHVAKLAAQAKRLGHSPTPDIREVITERLLEKAHAGRITGRSDVLNFLREQGFAVARAGVNYLTIICPDSGERVRLKGNLFREHFRPQDLEPARVHHDPAQLLVLDRRLARLMEKRAAYHRARYGISESVEVTNTKEEPSHDRTGNTVPTKRSTLGTSTSGIQPALRGDALRFSEAAERFGCATDSVRRAIERFEQTHRTFAGNFDTTIASIACEAQTQALVRRYGAAPSSAPGITYGHHMELEREL